MKILVTGSSGTIGSELMPYLQALGHEVVAFRRPSSSNNQSLVGFDAVINLAGAPIAAGRWNSRVKEKIVASRVETTKYLVEAMRACKKPPGIFLSASATGFYGDRGDEVLTDDSLKGKGFLADVGSQWEYEANRAQEFGVRVVCLRIGIVLSSKGGALYKMLPAFRLGLGAKLGSGSQWMSWISIQDLLSIMQWCLVTESAAGAINAVSPMPVLNEEFTKTLANVLHRPAWFRAPAWLLRLMLGEMADALLLASTRVKPKKLLASGFEFTHTNLEKALRAQLEK